MLLAAVSGAALVHLPSFDGKLFTLLDAGTAADAARRVELGFGHADDAEVVHADFAAVIGAARESDFDVEVIGENGLFDAFSQGRRIVVGKGTDAIADASHDVSRTGRVVAAAFFRLVDAQRFDDGLQGLIDFVRTFQG